MRLCTILLVSFNVFQVWTFPQASTSSEDLKMEARIDDDVDDYGAPGFFPFHNGEAFTVEKDPATGTLDFNKTPDYTFYKDNIDRKDSRPKIQPYHTPNDIPSNPFKISAVDSSPDLHQFLNLPVHYSTSGKFPLISSSYANMKIQGASGSSSSTGSNHKHYTPASSTTTRAPSYYTSATMKTSNPPTVTTTPARTTSQQTQAPTTKISTTTTTTTTTPKPTTTTEKQPPRVIQQVPQQVWNISEPVDYLPEEEMSYVDYEYEPEMINQFAQQNNYGSQQNNNGAQQNYHGAQQNNHGAYQNHHSIQQNNQGAQQTIGGSQHTNHGSQQYSHGSQQNSHGGYNQQNMKDSNEKVEEYSKPSSSPPTTVSTTTTTTTTPLPETTEKITTTTSKVSIVTSAPILNITQPSTPPSSTQKTQDNQFSTSMPVSSSGESVRPGVGNTYLFSGNVAENSVSSNNKNFFRPTSNEGPFKPMPTMNESTPSFNEMTESEDSEDYVNYNQRPVPSNKPDINPNQYQHQRPQGRPNESNKQEPPFPFENAPPQFNSQNNFQKPSRPTQVEQSRPERPQYEQHPRPYNNQQNNKNERPQKLPGHDSSKQDTFAIQVNSSPFQLQSQYNKPDRPNKISQGQESHQPFDGNVIKHSQFHRHPVPEGLPQTQFTAHLSTGQMPHVNRPQNQNIHPSDLRPPPPPEFQENQDEEVNLVKKPAPSKPVKISSSIKPVPASGGFVNIQPGKIQNMVPIRIPTEVDQNSQSYSLQTSFSIGAGGEDSRHPVAHGSVIDENINSINRSEFIPPHIPQQPQQPERRPERPQQRPDRIQNIRPPPQNQVHHWESYSPHHYSNNKVKTDTEVLKPNLPNILPQFRPNAKVGHVDPNTQYIPSNIERVKQPLEHLQPPPLPRPQYLRIDRNDEDVQENNMHQQQGKQSMRVFQKPPTGNKVTTLQMMQQGQGAPSIPLKRIIRTENKPPHPKFQEKPHKPMMAQLVHEKVEGGKPLHVVYPTSNQRLTPTNEDVVVVGTHGAQRPSPPNNLQNIDNDPFPLDDPVPFLMSDRDRDTPILKTKPNKPLKNDFPYSLVKHNDLLEEEKIRKPLDQITEENKFAQEYTAFSPTESTNKKMDPDPELNVIPYLQDYSPYATRKPSHVKPISVTLKNILANPTPKPNVGTIERVEIKAPSPSKHKYSSGNQEFTVGTVIDMLTGNHKGSNSVNGFVQQVNTTTFSGPSHSSSDVHKNYIKQSYGDVQTQDFQAPFQPSLSNPENQGWRVIGNITREVVEEKQSEDGETTVKPSDFSFEQFKPQLFGGFKPIVPSESEEEQETELDA